MTDSSFDDKDKITQIINSSSRLKYLLMFLYNIPLDDIISVRVDGDNLKVDISTATEMLRFKPQNLEHVVMKNPEIGVAQVTFDPALAQGIYEIIDEYTN
jgi:hypothetical protein